MDTNIKMAFLARLLLLTFPISVNLYGQTFMKDHHPVYNPVGTLSCGTTRDFLPVSPSAASLGIFGQIPVGNYTGTAMVNVPLYEIVYKELSIPINLSYHASGNKPDLFPGPVGLGWTLQAGGCISRMTRGNPDYEEVKGINYLHTKPLWEDPRKREDWYKKDVLKSYLMNPFFYKSQYHRSR